MIAISEKTYAVRERIINDIKKKIKDPDKQRFLLGILEYELRHLDDPRSFRYKESYENLLIECARKGGKK